MDLTREIDKQKKEMGGDNIRIDFLFFSLRISTICTNDDFCSRYQLRIDIDEIKQVFSVEFTYVSSVWSMNNKWIVKKEVFHSKWAVGGEKKGVWHWHSTYEDEFKLTQSIKLAIINDRSIFLTLNRRQWVIVLSSTMYRACVFVENL